MVELLLIDYTTRPEETFAAQYQRVLQKGDLAAGLNGLSVSPVGHNLSARGGQHAARGLQ
jgi:hypothetical protein